MNVWTVCGFLLCALCINLLIRQYRPEFVPLVTAACGVLFGVAVLQETVQTVASLSSLVSQKGLSGYLGLLLKSLAAAISCQLTAALCRDCGESALAEKAELAGKLAILALSIPSVVQLLEWL
ncbi:MAG: stage III sporulation AC/AD family protein [Loktanella sp.]|nr:stage III sporulation AC/AD family protein [Loktanella sp.]